MNLPPLIQSFVLHFGEMGSRWGINRTVGQIYALLYVSPEPLCADQIVDALGISRSNVSMSLRELQAWNLVLLKHLPNDRRDFFTTPDDVWQILRTLAEERKKREVDPTLSVLREMLMQKPQSEAERHSPRRGMAEMHGLIEQLTTWYDDVKTARDRAAGHPADPWRQGDEAARGQGPGRLVRAQDARKCVRRRQGRQQGMSSILVDQASQALTRDTRAPAAATAAPAASRAVGASLRAAVGLQSRRRWSGCRRRPCSASRLAASPPASRRNRRCCRRLVSPRWASCAPHWTGLARALPSRPPAPSLTTLRHTAVATVATRSPLDAGQPARRGMSPAS